MNLKKDKALWEEAINSGCKTMGELAIFIKIKQRR